MHLRPAFSSRSFRNLAYFSAVWLCALCTGCRARQSAPSPIECRISPQLPHVGPATIQIGLHEKGEEKISGAKVTVEATMAHPGMQPIFVEATPAFYGGYEARLNFSMPGDWTVVVNADFANRTHAEKQLTVTVKEK